MESVSIKKIATMTKNHYGDMESKFILIKYLVHQEDIIIYMYTHYNIGSKTIKES